MREAAGLAGRDEPALLVAEKIIAALESGEFHIFPDAIAQQTGNACRSFPESVIEADISKYETNWNRKEVKK